MMPEIRAARVVSRFATLFDKMPAMFEVLYGSVDRLVEFWSAMANAPQYLQSKLRHVRDHQRNFHPMTLFGDGVASYALGKAWSKTVNVWTFSCLTKSPAHQGFRGLLAQMLITMCHKNDCVAKFNANTHKAIYKVLKWSLQALYDGIWPLLRPDNSPWPASSDEQGRAGKLLAGGKRGVVWHINFDLDWAFESLGLPRWNSRSPCAKCGVTIATVSDIRSPAPWIDSVYDHDKFVRANLATCPLFSVTDITVETLKGDWLHSKHQGTDSYLFGGTLSGNPII